MSISSGEPTSASVPAPPELASLYPRLNPQLQRVVARNVTAPAVVIEEACQFAWSRWLAARGGIATPATLGWLITTATREALHLVRAQAREVSLEDPGVADRVVALPSRAPDPQRVVVLQEQLAQIHQLPVRQQRMVWLLGLGFDYNEIASRTGDSRRTVERQLQRAKHKLRSAG